MAVFDIRTRPRSAKFVFSIEPQQQAGTEQCNECRSLQLVGGILDETSNLLGRFTSPAFYQVGLGIAKIGGIEFPYSIVVEAGALPDRSRTGFVTNHPESELKLAAFLRISIIGETHFYPFMLVLNHIQ